ncbi:MAG: hypothetical protein WCF16_02415 [Alphaproteobacteria bacterium]
MGTYEDLAGAHGRKIFYRAERFKARDLFGRLVPEVDVGGLSLTLDDLSMSGLAGFADQEASEHVRVGLELPIRLRTGDAILHHAKARICRVDPRHRGTRIALNFVTNCLDVCHAVARHREVSLRQELDLDLVPTNGLIADEYRTLATDVVHMVRRYGAALRRIASLGNGSAEANEARMTHALNACEERLIPEWRMLWHRANEIVAPIMSDPDKLRATKHFTELVVTPDFLDGPIWERSYRKPLGYPGDYEVMNQVYSWRREGGTPLGKLLQRIGLDVAECIATRMVMIQQAIGQVVASAETAGPLRITSIGCGPAQEVFNYLQLRSLSRPVEFTLVDPEHEAVSYAYRRIYPETVRLSPNAAVHGLEMSFAQIIKADDLVHKVPSQDLIYSVGLVDYLTLRRTRELVHRLYDQLAPGGLLIIGNMKDTPIGNLWPMEFICDWSVNYRSEAEMLSLADGLDPASVAIKPDPTGRVLMLYLRKRRA